MLCCCHHRADHNWPVRGTLGTPRQGFGPRAGWDGPQAWVLSHHQRRGSYGSWRPREADRSWPEGEGGGGQYTGAFQNNENGGTQPPKDPLTWAPNPPAMFTVSSLADSSLSNQEAPTLPTSAQLADFSKSPNCPDTMLLGLSHSSLTLPPPGAGPHPSKCLLFTLHLFNSPVPFRVEP